MIKTDIINPIYYNYKCVHTLMHYETRKAVHLCTRDHITGVTAILYYSITDALDKEVESL